MNALAESLAVIAANLDAIGARWALVGGLAVSVRAEPRLTRDVDVAVAVADDQEAEQIVAELRSRGYEVAAVVEQTAAGRLATARLTSQGGSTLVDLLFASSGIEAEVVAAAERLEIVAGLVLPVARGAHLIALKLLARDDRRRPQDWDDLRALVAVSSPGELEEARTAARLIEARGYHRGRQLEAALDAFLAEVP